MTEHLEPLLTPLLERVGVPREAEVAADALRLLGAAWGLVLLVGILTAWRRGILIGLAHTVVRGALVLLLVAWWLAPVVSHERVVGPTLDVHVDVSRSVAPAARERLEAELDALADRGVRVRRLPFDPAASPEALATALALAGASPVDPLAPHATLIATDGHLARPDSRVQPPARGPLRVTALAGREPSFLDMETVSIAVAGAEDDQPIFRWTGQARRGGEVQLDLLVDGKRQELGSRVLEAGEVLFEGPLPEVDPGSRALQFEVRDSEDRVLARAGASWLVPAMQDVLIVGAAEGFAARALRTQEVEHRQIDVAAFLEDPGLSMGADVIVLEDVFAGALDGGATDAIRAHLARGGGLCVLPSEERGALFAAAPDALLEMLPLRGLEPAPEPPEPEEEPPPPTPEEGLAPPDPEDFEEETRTVKTLGMLLLIDASSSMKGMRLRLAKQAAIASANQMHPEDEIAVVAFSGRAQTVMALAKTGDGSQVRDRVARIVARGPTDFRPALRRALDVLDEPRIAIRHVVLLSDGEPRAAPLRPFVSELRERGITLSTVGCGPGFNAQLMSNLAAWGGGKFHAAYNANELPAVFVVEAQRVIAATGARKREDATGAESETPPVGPEPEVEEQPTPEPDRPVDEQRTPLALQTVWPAAWTRDLKLQDAAGVFEVHPVAWRDDAWPAIETVDGQPVAAHGRVGAGRVVAFALPLDGAWAAPLASWPGRARLLDQAVAWAAPPPGAERYALEVTTEPLAFTARVFDRTRRQVEEDLTLEVFDAEGRAVEASVERLGDDRFRVALTADAAGRVLWPRVVGRGTAAGSTRPVPVAFGRVGEAAVSGTDPAVLGAWATALGGELHALATRGLVPPAITVATDRPLEPDRSAWLLPLLVLELGLSRCRRRRAA